MKTDRKNCLMLYKQKLDHTQILNHFKSCPVMCWHLYNLQQKLGTTLAFVSLKIIGNVSNCQKNFTSVNLSLLKEHRSKLATQEILSNFVK